MVLSITVVALLSRGSHILQFVSAARFPAVASSERARRRGWGVATISSRIITENTDHRSQITGAGEFSGSPDEVYVVLVPGMYCLLHLCIGRRDILIVRRIDYMF